MGLSVRLDSKYILYEDFLKVPISSQSIFGNSNKLNVEIGSGKGKFLLTAGQLFPTENFLGLEKTPKCLKVYKKKVERDKIDNTRVIHCYLESIFKNLIDEESIDSFIIYFPDPWPKKKHRKRRFLKEENIRMLWKKLKKGGEIFIKTDFEDYFIQIIEEFLKIDEFLKISYGYAKNWKHKFNIPTNYEIKYVKAGKPIYYLQAKKS